jgi:hypothetical protein
MNLWAKAQRHLLMRAKTRMLNFPFKFSATTLQYPLSLPRTIASSIPLTSMKTQSDNISYHFIPKMKMIRSENNNSALLNKLKYYPVSLLLIIVLFSLVYYFTAAQNSDPNKLWGNGKETAHQIARHFLP